LFFYDYFFFQKELDFFSHPTTLFYISFNAAVHGCAIKEIPHIYVYSFETL